MSIPLQIVYDFQEFPHACLEFTLILGSYQVSSCFVAFDNVLRSLRPKNSCMSCSRIIHKLLVEFLHNWQAIGPWFLEMIFDSCCFKGFHVFSKVLAQKNKV